MSLNSVVGGGTPLGSPGLFCLQEHRFWLTLVRHLNSMLSRCLKRLGVVVVVSSGSAEDWISCLRSCLTAVSHDISLLVAAVIVTFTKDGGGQMFPNQFNALLSPFTYVLSCKIIDLLVSLPFNYILNLSRLFILPFQLT